MWFKKIMVRFFISLDSILFNFIGTLYDLLISISRTSILTQGDIAAFASRIELLLGIFMLFKLSFSLITYIVNPDDFSDSGKGFGKLVQNSVITLIMLILVPYAFQMAFNLQAKILDDNILAKLLLGDRLMADEDGAVNNETIMDTAGNRMAFQVMLPFFTPRYSVSELSDCIVMYDSDGSFSETCYDALSSIWTNETYLQNYTIGIENKSLGLTFRETAALETAKDEDDNEYFIIDYKYLLSTVVAVVVCILLITFCIDVGLRSVKLAFLQLVYPIPVISFIDPSSGKDGMFKKWYQMCFSTFLSLFIRLLALYFGIYIIVRVGDMGMYDVVNGSQVTNFWVQIFVIIGILMFIKQMPKILEGLGIKMDGDFSFNPLKKIEKEALGGGILKKPNEMLAKGAKGIAHAPLGFASTMGRKSIAAIDSMKNGRGFRAGWSSQHGKMYDAYRKKKDEWMPHDAERHKSKIEGRNEFDRQHKLWARGRDAWSKKGVGGNPDAFDGQNRKAYEAAYGKRNGAFINSKMELDKISTALKTAQREYEIAQANGTATEEMYKNYQKLNSAKEKAQKDHDIMRKRYIEAAEIEDALDYTESKRGYDIVSDSDHVHSVNKTNISRDATSIHRHREYGFSPSTADTTGGEPTE